MHGSICHKGRPLVSASESSVLPASFFQPPVLRGLQLASCRCNLTAPCPVLLFPLPGFCFFAGLFKLSCRIEQLVAHKGGQLEHVEHLCTGSSHSSASLSLSLARAPWIRVLKGGCVRKPLSYALCSVEPTLRQFIPHFLK